MCVYVSLSSRSWQVLRPPLLLKVVPTYGWNWELEVSLLDLEPAERA